MAGSSTEHAARRDTRISIEQLKAATEVSESGHVDETIDTNWGQIATRWAEVYTKGSREFFRGEQIASDVTHKVKIRWDKQLWARLVEPAATKMRVRISGRKLNLSGPPINDDEQNEYISFPCMEVR
jgi:SPP1 family predicted phage head-tail adaptor